MIALTAFVLALGSFLAGAMFGAGWGPWVLLGFCMIGLGCLIAAAQTRGFEGQYIRPKAPPYYWETLYMDVVRLAIDRGVVHGKEPMYVQTPRGPVPITGIFAARINHVMSLVLDTTEETNESVVAAHP